MPTNRDKSRQTLTPGETTVSLDREASDLLAIFALVMFVGALMVLVQVLA
jgi:hypothetical protein